MNSRQVLYFCVALSGILLVTWQDRRQKLAVLQEKWNARFGEAATEDSPARDAWWSMYFPALPTGERSSSAVQAQTEQVVSGWSEIADEELAELVAREAERWSNAPAAALRDARWQVHDEAGDYAVLSFSGSGSDADALAWLQHLLAAPNGSSAYLSDPARIDLIAIEPSGLRLQAEFRIWPNSAFVGQTIPGGAQ